MRASRCNPGQSNENGSIESRHDSLKTALDQALRLRGSRCFERRAPYEALVETIVARLNARVAVRLLVELPDRIALTLLLAPRPGLLPTVRVELPDLAGFDALLGVRA